VQRKIVGLRGWTSCVSDFNVMLRACAVIIKSWMGY
jgi:hypothetical protein